jgi:formylglycine-generating enzyme required for sulfatase activity
LSNPPTGPGSGKKDAALIIGVEEYSFVEKVIGARRNADDWQAYLTATLRVPPGKVILLRDRNATAERIRKSATSIASEVAPGGTLWVIFIGHGAPSPDGKDGLLVGADAQAMIESFYARSLPIRELVGLLTKGKQARTVVIVDACFSGRASSGRTLVTGLQPLVVMRMAPFGHDQRIILMSAARSDQFAGALPRAEDPRPAFSYLVLGALRGWAADEKGRVRAGSVVDFARRALRLARDRTQTPELVTGSPAAILSIGTESAPDLGRIDREGMRPERRLHSPGRPSQIKAGIEWVTIPGGSFMMGAEESESAKPAHSVTVPTFNLAKTLVTVEQYKACVTDLACEPPLKGANCNWDIPDRDRHPINCIDWPRAKDFATWVGGRLPSEAEWEFASRGAGKDWRYPWGDEAASCQRGVLNEGGKGCGRDSTWPVCSKPLGNTAQGLCDMAGNLQEWVQDWYSRSYEGAPNDGRARETPPADQHKSSRVSRGSSWKTPPSQVCAVCRSSNRDYWYDDVGVRPAKTIR